MAYPTLWRTGTPALWSDMLNTRREVDRVFDRYFNSAAETVLAPVVDVRETTDALEVTAELPGLRSEDVDVSVENQVLTISGEKKQTINEGDQESNYHLIERRYGRFERSFTLPRSLHTDKVTARFENGLLTVTLPKLEEAKPRRIQVKVHE